MTNHPEPSPHMRGLAPTHPGEVLREITLPALALSKVEFARRLGVGRRTLYDLIEEKAGVTPGMALRLGKLLGNGPVFWMNLQAAYDLRLAEAALAEDIAAIQTIETAGGA